MYVINKSLLLGAFFCLSFLSALAQNPSISLPAIGVNGQINTYDAKNVNYSSALFTDAVNELKLPIVRFPGGTNANSYNWVTFNWAEDGGRTFSILDQEEAFAREGSHLGITTLEEVLGCSNMGTWQQEKSVFESSMIRTNDLLSDFKSNILDANNSTPVYVIRVFDPFYYIGRDANNNLRTSPFFALEAAGWNSPAVNTYCGNDVRCIIKRAALADMRRILIKILYEYQDNPSDVTLFDAALNHNKLYKKTDLFNLQEILPIPQEQLIVYDEMYFEFGNELYSYVYSKFLPEAGITTPPCLDPDPLTDASLYAEIVADIIPMVKTYFPNAQLGVIAGNRRGCSLWTTRVTEKLRSIPSFLQPDVTAYDQIDAFTLHFYPATDSLMNILNPSVSSLFHYRDQLLKLLANEFESNYEDKDLWVTEIGFPAPEYEAQRPFIGTWYETLMLLSFIHEIGLRERFVQNYLDQISSEYRRDALRHSPILPDFHNIEMVLLHTIGVNYGEDDLEFQGVLRGLDQDGDNKVDSYKLSGIGLAANIYRQFMNPQSASGQLFFQKSLPLIPQGAFIDSMEIVRRCAYSPKPKDMVYFNGVMGMRAYASSSSPERMQDLFINLSNVPVNISNWSLPFMDNGTIDHVWTYTAAGLSQDLLLDMGSLRTDLFSVNADEVLPSASQIGIQVNHVSSAPALIMPPRSVMLVSRVASPGAIIDDHGLTTESLRSSLDSSVPLLLVNALRNGESLSFNKAESGLCQVYDLQGRKIFSLEVQEDISLKTQVLSPGNYLLVFYPSTGAVRTAQFTVSQ